VAAFSLASRLRAGDTVFSAWCTLASPLTAETVAREGFAAVVLDVQHGLWDTATLIVGVSALHHAGSAPVVRVSLDDLSFVSRALDFGAEAIIAPMVNSAADARRFVSVAKFPPLGERSWGPQRAMTLQGYTSAVDYLREANEETMMFAMIETPTALNDVDDIAAIDGIDALFVGPYDLSTALSAGRAQDVTAPEVERAIDKICAAANKAGKIPGIYCRDAARALAMSRRGFKFIAIGSDLAIMRDGAAEILKVLRG
jgi:4-hydroxy-2-oxoheptanedioate aldolase